MTPDRKKKICPRCLEKVKEREEWRKKQKEAEEKKREEAKKQAAAKASPAALKQTTPLTDDLRGRILNEYEPYRHQRDLPWKKIHAEIARKMKVSKSLVGEALREESRRLIVPPEMRQEIIRRYQDYVLRMERPPKGRRKTIAADLGTTFRAVASTVRDWKRAQSPMKDLSRENRFLIEKEYFRALDAGRPLADLAEEMARRANSSSFHILRYLDLIHDGLDRLKRVPEATPEEREKVLSAYAEYLSADSPPEPFLHNHISARTGVTPQTVHKTLLRYRLERLGKAVLPRPEGS